MLRGGLLRLRLVAGIGLVGRTPAREGGELHQGVICIRRELFLAALGSRCLELAVDEWLPADHKVRTAVDGSARVEIPGTFGVFVDPGAAIPPDPGVGLVRVV